MCFCDTCVVIWSQSKNGQKCNQFGCVNCDDAKDVLSVGHCQDDPFKIPPYSLQEVNLNATYQAFKHRDCINLDQRIQDSCLTGFLQAKRMPDIMVETTMVNFQLTAYQNKIIKTLFPKKAYLIVTVTNGRCCFLSLKVRYLLQDDFLTFDIKERFPCTLKPICEHDQELTYKIM